VGVRGFLFSTPVQTEPEAHPSICKIRYFVLFSVAKRPVLGVEHGPQNGADIENE